MSESLQISRLGDQGTGVRNPGHGEHERTPTQERWSRHIAHIRRLYIDENFPLEEVMGIMARDYDFHAGKKTYKTQLKRFGIKKNVRLGSKDALQAVQLIKGAEELGLELADRQVKLASGQVVGFKRLANHMGRKKLAVGSSQWTKPRPFVVAARHASATNPLPRNIDGPDIFRLPELVFLDVARYISQKFSVGHAALNPEIRGPDSPLAREAHSTIETAANLLADGKLNDAIVQLRAAPERLKRLLGNGDVEPPMTLFLIWKTVVSLIASARWAGLDVEETVKSLVRYIATICNDSPSISPQIRRIVAALSDLAQIDGLLMFKTAEQGILCMCAQHDLALGIPGSIYSSLQQSTRDWYASQKWMVSFEHTIWPVWERLVQLKGESAPEAIAALYSILVLERQKPRNRGEASRKFELAVEQTLRKIPDDAALALAHREAHMQWAVANMPWANDNRELVESYMRDAMETALNRQRTSLFEVSALRGWIAEGKAEVMPLTTVREGVESADAPTRQD